MSFVEIAHTASQESMGSSPFHAFMAYTGGLWLGLPSHNTIPPFELDQILADLRKGVRIAFSDNSSMVGDYLTLVLFFLVVMGYDHKEGEHFPSFQKKESEIVDLVNKIYGKEMSKWRWKEILSEIPEERLRDFPSLQRFSTF